MDKIQVEYGIEFSRLKKDLEDIKAALRNAEASGANSAKGIGDSFDKTNQKIIQNARSVNEFKTRIEQLTAARDRSFNTKAIEAFNQKIQQSEKEMNKLIEAGNKLPNSINNGKKSLSLLGQGVENVKGQFINLAKAAAGIFAVSKLIDFGKQVLDVTAAFQKYNAVLANTLGSSTAAAKAMAMIQEFAAKTPFSVDELTSSFVKLANQGFKPTANEMRKLGDLAASQGKSFDMLTEAIIDAQTGEFERLKEFGIRAQKEGDRVKFTFKGVKTEVDFTSDSIQKYILGLGNLQGISGGMAAISKTLGGQISNLGDNFDRLLLTIGSMSSGMLSSFISGLSTLLDVTTNLVKGGKSAAEAFDDQNIKVQDLEKNILPLADRYDELKSKTNLNKNEQAELKNIIKQLGDTMPDTITQFNKYGDAISINTGKVRENLEEEKARLKFLNQDAIKDNEKTLKNLELQAKNYQKALNEGGELRTTGFGERQKVEFVKLTNEEIKEQQSRLKKVQEQIKGVNAQIKKLRGEDLDVEKPETTKQAAAGLTGAQEKALEKEKEFDEKFKQLRLEQVAELNDELEKESLKEVDDRIKSREKEEEARRKIEQDSRDAEANEIARSIEGYEEAEKKKTQSLKEEAEKRQQIYAAVEQLGMQAVDGILELSRANRQRDMEELNAKQSEEQDLLQQQLDNRLISEDVYAQKKKELDTKQAEELKKQKIKQFEAERSEALFKIAIETAVAVAKAVAASPVTFGLPFSAFALTQGAIQAGLVLAQPIPKFAKGVIDLKGPGTATSDSIPAYLSRGESVMTAIETERHKRALQAMRDGVFDNNYISYEEINRRSEAADRSLAKLKSEKQVNDLAKALAITLNGNNNAEDLYYINKQLRANKKVGLEDETIERLGSVLKNDNRNLY